MVFLDVSASLSLKLHNKSLYFVSLVTAYRAFAFLREPRHRLLSLSFDCSAVPCIAVVGTSIVAPACYGANIVAHVFAGFLCSALPIVVLTEFLCSALSIAVLAGFLCSALLIAVLAGFLCSALSTTVVTGYRGHRVSVFCLTY
ncbi:hypothetical protein L3X38_024827 [Prunus dulcis]|uniref:Transmembrane protein n=1 Tax=Prunus dulcis TaxID=3755 RepID=A0AAD4W0I6_PRUDU|nr:hypothetical protein L3X38_024827 [Prunus dulcis]